MGSLWAKTSIGLAIGSIFTFAIANFILTGAILRDNPLLTPLGYFLVVDWSLRTWQILVVVIAALSLLIVLFVNDVGGKYDIATKNADSQLLAQAERNFGWIERLVRFRLLLTVTLWFLIAAQAMLYFNSVKCWFPLPPNAQSWAEWAYGKKLPSPHCAVGKELSSVSVPRHG